MPKLLVTASNALSLSGMAWASPSVNVTGVGWEFVAETFLGEPEKVGGEVERRVGPGAAVVGAAAAGHSYRVVEHLAGAARDVQQAATAFVKSGPVEEHRYRL